MIFYDFETFEFDWLLVSLDTKAKSETIIVNDKKLLE